MMSTFTESMRREMEKLRKKFISHATHIFRLSIRRSINHREKNRCIRMGIFSFHPHLIDSLRRRNKNQNFFLTKNTIFSLLDTIMLLSLRPRTDNTTLTIMKILFDLFIFLKKIFSQKFLAVHLKM